MKAHTSCTGNRRSVTKLRQLRSPAAAALPDPNADGAQTPGQTLRLSRGERGGEWQSAAPMQ